MATLSVTALSRTGDNDLVAHAVAADAALSDKWTNTGAEFVYLNNAGGSPCVVTLTGGVGFKLDGITPVALTVTVAAGKSALFGPFPVKWYNDASNFASIAYSQVASVKVGIYQFPGTPTNN